MHLHKHIKYHMLTWNIRLCVCLCVCVRLHLSLDIRMCVKHLHVHWIIRAYTHTCTCTCAKSIGANTHMHTHTRTHKKDAHMHIEHTHIHAFINTLPCTSHTVSYWSYFLTFSLLVCRDAIKSRWNADCTKFLLKSSFDGEHILCFIYSAFYELNKVLTTLRWSIVSACMCVLLLCVNDEKHL